MRDEYGSSTAPQAAWGNWALQQLPQLPKGAHVVDAGCGNGRDGAVLKARRPDLHLTLIERSDERLTSARETLSDAENVTFIQQDLVDPWPLARPADAVFSVAVFHWVLDHRALFENARQAMRPGAALVVDCGGGDCLAAVREAIREAGDEHERYVNYETVGSASSLLEETGFVVRYAAIVEQPWTAPSRTELEDHLRRAVLQPELRQRAPEESDEFVRRVADRLPARVVDYVRLRVVALRQ